MRGTRFALCLWVVLSLLAAGTGPLAWAEEDAAKAPADDRVTIEFPNGQIQLERLLQAFGRVGNFPLLWDPESRAIKGRSIARPNAISCTRDEFFETLRTLHLPQELVVMPLGSGRDVRYWVADMRQVSTLLKLRPKAVVVDASNVGDLEKQEGLFVTTAIHLDHVVDLRELRTALQRIVSGQNIGNVTEVPGAHVLVVTDFAPVVAAIWRLVRQVDVPAAAREGGTGDNTWIHAVPLRHGNAAEMADILGGLFHANAPASWNRDPKRGDVDPKEDTGLRILADRRLNQILVRGTPSQFESVQQVIQAMDKPSKTPETTELQVSFVRLQHARANAVANALMGLIGRGQASWMKAFDGLVPTVVPEQASNALLIQGTPEAIEKLRRLVTEIDQKPRGDEDAGEEKDAE